MPMTVSELLPPRSPGAVTAQLSGMGGKSMVVGSLQPEKLPARSNVPTRDLTVFGFESGQPDAGVVP